MVTTSWSHGRQIGLQLSRTKLQGCIQHEMRSAIVFVDHAPTEMVLTRQCADVSKLMYHMRINVDVLDHDLLASF